MTHVARRLSRRSPSLVVLPCVSPQTPPRTARRTAAPALHACACCDARARRDAAPRDAPPAAMPAAAAGDPALRPTMGLQGSRACLLRRRAVGDGGRYLHADRGEVMVDDQRPTARASSGRSEVSSDVPLRTGVDLRDEICAASSFQLRRSTPPSTSRWTGTSITAPLVLTPPCAATCAVASRFRGVSRPITVHARRCGCILPGRADAGQRVGIDAVRIRGELNRPERLHGIQVPALLQPQVSGTIRRASTSRPTAPAVDAGGGSAVRRAPGAGCFYNASRRATTSRL